MKHVPIEKPKKRHVYAADQQDLENVEKLARERLVVLRLDRAECEDYLVDPVTQQLIYPIKSIQINSTQYHLVPGVNRVPLSVYKFYMETRDMQEKARRMNDTIRKSRMLMQLY